MDIIIERLTLRNASGADEDVCRYRTKQCTALTPRAVGAPSNGPICRDVIEQGCSLPARHQVLNIAEFRYVSRRDVERVSQLLEDLDKIRTIPMSQLDLHHRLTSFGFYKSVMMTANTVTESLDCLKSVVTCNIVVPKVKLCDG